MTFHALSKVIESLRIKLANGSEPPLARLGFLVGSHWNETLFTTGSDMQVPIIDHPGSHLMDTKRCCACGSEEDVALHDPVAEMHGGQANPMPFCRACRDFYRTWLPATAEAVTKAIDNYAVERIEKDMNAPQSEEPESPGYGDRT